MSSTELKGLAMDSTSKFGQGVQKITETEKEKRAKRTHVSHQPWTLIAPGSQGAPIPDPKAPTGSQDNPVDDNLTQRLAQSKLTSLYGSKTVKSETLSRDEQRDQAIQSAFKTPQPPPSTSAMRTAANKEAISARQQQEDKLVGEVSGPARKEAVSVEQQQRPGDPGDENLGVDRNTRVNKQPVPAPAPGEATQAAAGALNSTPVATSAIVGSTRSQYVLSLPPQHAAAIVQRANQMRAQRLAATPASVSAPVPVEGIGSVDQSYVGSGRNLPGYIVNPNTILVGDANSTYLTMGADGSQMGNNDIFAARAKRLELKRPPTDDLWWLKNPLKMDSVDKQMAIAAQNASTMNVENVKRQRRIAEKELSRFPRYRLYAGMDHGSEEVLSHKLI